MQMNVNQFTSVFGLVCLLFLNPMATHAQIVLCDNLGLDKISNSQSFLTKNELVHCAFKIQNEAFLLDEMECKFDSARILTEKALEIWRYIDDTLNQANLLKYLGYLNGHLGKLDLAKSQIHEAIKFYKLKNAEYGVAVSLFNLSRVYEYQHNIDSALYYANRSKEFWTIQKDAGRLLSLNNHLLHLYSLSGSSENYEILIEQNNRFVEAPDIYWQNELDFYFVTSELYEKHNLIREQEKFVKLYEMKIEELQHTVGTKPYSLYDERNCR